MVEGCDFPKDLKDLELHGYNLFIAEGFHLHCYDLFIVEDCDLQCSDLIPAEGCDFYLL